MVTTTLVIIKVMMVSISVRQCNDELMKTVMVVMMMMVTMMGNSVFLCSMCLIDDYDDGNNDNSEFNVFFCVV